MPINECMKIKMMILLLLGFSMVGCYYHKEELLTCTVDPATTKYSTTISTILNSYGCVSCHNSVVLSGTYDFTTHAGLKRAVDNNRLLGAINHLPGFLAMPQGGSKMSACDINKVKAWVDAGAPNN